LEFHKPKTDRCDQCEAYKNNPDKTQEATENNRLHIERKQSTKDERDTDRNCVDEEQAVLCIDLENVITLPRSNISSMLHKRKLNVYNMTGHLSKNNQTKALCVVWNESQSGRAGNDMASAVYRMLQEVLVPQPNLKRLAIWSDAGVPQNRNSLMSMAIMKFMIENQTLTSITQKFGEPGHSAIQEVDNIHGQAEKRLKGAEIFSPIELIRVLKSANLRNRFVVIQLRNFMNFQAVAKQMTLGFGSVPYTQVRLIVKS